jgi:predicted nucleic acid binding AN1-type Zn finger protein
MDEKQIQHEKCIAACGFYANSDKNGYCSLCWKSLNKSNTKKPRDNLTNVIISPPLVKETKSKDSDKCEMCSKRIGLLGFLCKCGKRFCGLHRHAETHMCGVDFKMEKQLELEQKLYSVKPNKINKL